MKRSDELIQENTVAERLAVGISRIFQRGFIEKLRVYCKGNVLDVGGRDYFLRVRDEVDFDFWTCLEYDEDMLLRLNDPRYECVHGDGCDMFFDDESFDTVINNNVLEHVFEPVAMVNEIARVLKPSGVALFVIPQTADVHMAPYNFHNFTRFWIIEVMKRAELEIVELVPTGGVWRTIASRSVLFFWHAFRAKGYYIEGVKRPWTFYLLFPLMALHAVVTVPVAMLLSLGDLVEEATGHTVVVRKAARFSPD